MNLIDHVLNGPATVLVEEELKRFFAVELLISCPQPDQGFFMWTKYFVRHIQNSGHADYAVRFSAS
jgi:hypothetical protein